MGNLYPYLVGAGAIVLMMSVWAVVQAAWKQTFRDMHGDEDTLAGRSGCAGCSHDRHCEVPSAGHMEREDCDQHSDIVRVFDS